MRSKSQRLRGQSGYGDCTTDCAFSVPFFQSLRSHTNTLSSVAAFAGPIEVGFSGNGPASITRGLFVSGDYFTTVGVTAFLGRLLGPADDSPSASPAVVLDYGYWQRAFGADPSALGRTVRLNNVDVVIVGISSPGFNSLTPGKHQDFFMPLSLAKRVRSEWWDADDRLSDTGTWWVLIAGRLKPGIPIAQAQAETTTLFRSEVLHGTKPAFAEADAPMIRLLPARQALDGESSQIAPMLDLIMIAVGLVLMIACANVAGLILARSTRRQKELAVRQALGAGRARIARQLLTESVLLSVAGGTLGILFAVWGVESITRFVSNGLDQPFSYVITPDWRVLSFTLGLTLATGVLCGLAPALRGLRGDLTPSLRENSSSIPGAAPQAGRRFRLGDALVVAQVALSIVVLVGAGLLVRTLQKLQTVNPGFDTQNILLFGMNPNLAGYNDRQMAQLYHQLQDRFAALPGVVSASYSESALLSRKLVWHGCASRRRAPQNECQHGNTCGGLGFLLDDAHPHVGGPLVYESRFRCGRGDEDCNHRCGGRGRCFTRHTRRTSSHRHDASANRASGASRARYRQPGLCAEVLPQPGSIGEAYGQRAGR